MFVGFIRRVQRPADHDAIEAKCDAAPSGLAVYLAKVLDGDIQAGPLKELLGPQRSKVSRLARLLLQVGS